MPTDSLPSFRTSILKHGDQWCQRIPGGYQQVVDERGLKVNELMGGSAIAEVFKIASGNPPSAVGGWSAQAEKALRCGFWIRQDPATFSSEGEGEIEKVKETGIDPRYFTANKSYGFKWCGLFATAVLKSAGWDVKWSNRQMEFGPYEEVQKLRYDMPAWKATTPEAGDVAIKKGGSQHHMVIAESTGADSFWVIEGNMGPPHPVWCRGRKLVKSDLEILYKLPAEV